VAVSTEQPIVLGPLTLDIIRRGDVCPGRILLGPSDLSASTEVVIQPVADSADFPGVAGTAQDSFVRRKALRSDDQTYQAGMALGREYYETHATIRARVGI